MIRMVLSYQREENIAICNDVDRTRGIMLSEISQSGKKITVWLHIGEIKEAKQMGICEGKEKQIR